MIVPPCVTRHRWSGSTIFLVRKPSAGDALAAGAAILQRHVVAAGSGAPAYAVIGPVWVVLPMVTPDTRGWITWVSSAWSSAKLLVEANRSIAVAGAAVNAPAATPRPATA